MTEREISVRNMVFPDLDTILDIQNPFENWGLEERDQLLKKLAENIKSHHDKHGSRSYVATSGANVVAYMLVEINGQSARVKEFGRAANQSVEEPLQLLINKLKEDYPADLVKQAFWYLPKNKEQESSLLEAAGFINACKNVPAPRHGSTHAKILMRLTY